MFIVLPSMILVITALMLVILYRFRPGFRYTWLIAAGGTTLAWILLLTWRSIIPLSSELFNWQPVELFPYPISFMADQHGWIYSSCLAGLAIAVLLTTATQEYFPNSLWWAGTLGVIAIGILAVAAGNPLTLILLWTVIDFIELGIHTSPESVSNSYRRIVLPFLFRIMGTSAVVWSGMVSLSLGTRLDFSSLTGQAAVFWVIGVALRLCSFFFESPVQVNSDVRQGFRTALGYVSAASSLILLARLPLDATSSTATPFLLILAALVSLYCGSRWFQATDGIAGSTYWILGLSALALSAAMRGNPFGATAWGSMMILSGGSLTLNSIRKDWTDRALLINLWGLSTLPFSMGAVAWLSTAWFQITLPLLIISQALIVAGYITKTLNPAERSPEQALPSWTRMFYPAGLVVLIGLQVIFGVWGWAGAMRIGSISAAIVATVLSIGITFGASRVRRFIVIPGFWLKTSSLWSEGLVDGFRGFSRLLNRITLTITEVLEGDGGVMWTLLFLVLFVSLMSQGRP